MSLRIRLLLAAAGIVAISLLLSGILSFLLVRTLEFDNAQIELDRLAITAHRGVLRAECLTAQPQPRTDCVGGKLATPEVYKDRLHAMVPFGLSDRLLLLDSHGFVVFDSDPTAPVGNRLTLDRTRKIDQDIASEGVLTLAGQAYIGAGAALGARRDPLGANRVVLVRSSDSINTTAIEKLLPRLLEAGLLALVVALGIALILSRAFARPLSELAAAAEDIAQGNYSRRVAVVGRDEIGVVGRSFNRMAEAVERARTMQRDFLANVSHELKTPLTSLIGFSQALTDGSLTTREESVRAAQIIHEEAERVLRMSQELLDLARFESGQLPLHPTRVDIRALLEQEIEMVRPRAAKRGLQMDLKTPESLPPVNADPERLHQIVDNLLDNAVKYASLDGPVEVQVQNGLMNVEISISNRVGSYSPDPERMFDRFYRGDPSRSSAAGGVGLGLSISRELASALGGRLWAELSGGDLRMHLTLPAL